MTGVSLLCAACGRQRIVLRHAGVCRRCGCPHYAIPGALAPMAASPQDLAGRGRSVEVRLTDADRALLRNLRIRWASEVTA